MADSFLAYSIMSIRCQMKALDAALNILEEQLRGSDTKVESEPEPGLACPWCQTAELSEISAMGGQKSYACHHCDFRGAI